MDEHTYAAGFNLNNFGDGGDEFEEKYLPGLQR